MWRKITIGFVLAITAIIIGYDIFIVIKSPSDTISDVTMTTLWRFPFVIYAWMVLAGHFASLIKTKKRYIKGLIFSSLPILGLSFLTIFNIIKVNSILLLITIIFGFMVGMITWSQRRS